MRLLLIIFLYFNNALGGLTGNYNANPLFYSDTASTKYFLFSYFKGEDKGMYYAISTDGFNWKELNNGQPVLVPTVGKDTSY
jgi:hypothetical protein